MFTKDIIIILNKYLDDSEIVKYLQDIIKYDGKMVDSLTEIKNNLSEKLYKLSLSDKLNEESIILSKDLVELKRYITIEKESLREIITNNSQPNSNNCNLNIINQYDNLHPFKQFVKLYLSQDNVCPSCYYNMEDTKIIYSERKSDNTINRKTLNVYRCPCCHRMFIENDIMLETNINNTNIQLLNDYYKTDNVREMTFQNIIVLTTNRMCSKNHEMLDYVANVPVINKEGKIVFTKENISYCKQCQRYLMLKRDFEAINGIIACQIIDKTKALHIDNVDDEIEISQKQSVLYKYGYNVKTKDNISDKQRHMILSLVIESGILTRQQITSHLDTLIERGSKIPKWKDATGKWRQDRHYVSSYKTENLPKVITEKLILKYRTNVVK